MAAARRESPNPPLHLPLSPVPPTLSQTERRREDSVLVRRGKPLSKRLDGRYRRACSLPQGYTKPGRKGRVSSAIENNSGRKAGAEIIRSRPSGSFMANAENEKNLRLLEVQLLCACTRWTSTEKAEKEKTAREGREQCEPACGAFLYGARENCLKIEVGRTPALLCVQRRTLTLPHLLKCYEWLRCHTDTCLHVSTRVFLKCYEW
jgi:hypothetical protein